MCYIFVCTYNIVQPTADETLLKIKACSYLSRGTINCCKTVAIKKKVDTNIGIMIYTT